MNHKVSVIVPCYNQAQYLEESLLSILEQTFTNWECIIVNDGSTDKTKVISNKWVKRDLRFKYLYQNNKGLSSARNYGIAQAEGDLILPLDADDKIGKQYLELAYEEFRKNKDIKLVYCEAQKFGVVDELWELPDFSLFNLSLKNMIFCSAVFRKKDWEMVGGYDTNMVHGWEDWELWISMLKNGGSVKKLNDVQFYYRIKSESMLTSMNNDQIKKTEDYLSVKHADFFVEQLGSFNSLIRKYDGVERYYEKKLRSKRFILNLLVKRFLGLSFLKYSIK